MRSTGTIAACGGPPGPATTGAFITTIPAKRPCASSAAAPANPSAGAVSSGRVLASAPSFALTVAIGGDALGVAQTGQRDDVAIVDQVAVGQHVAGGGDEHAGAVLDLAARR